MSHKKDPNKLMLYAAVAVGLVVLFFILQRLTTQPPTGGGTLVNLPVTTVGSLDPGRAE